MVGITTTRALAVVATGLHHRPRSGNATQGGRRDPGAGRAEVAISVSACSSSPWPTGGSEAARAADRLRLIGRHAPEAADADIPALAWVDPRRVGAGVRRREADGGQLHPRCAEDQQHHDRRESIDDGPRRRHGRRRPGDEVQPDRPRGPLRLRQPAGDHHLEPRPPGRDDAAAVDDDTDAAIEAATEVLHTFPERFQAAGASRCTPSSASTPTCRVATT